MNVRYFEMSNGAYWFMEGLTHPHYVFNEDAIFSSPLKTASCDKYQVIIQSYKKQMIILHSS
jgi:coproporphyrinogen III oxidase